MTAKAEALRWQNLYEELKLTSRQLRESQLFSNEQLQQLHSQAEVWSNLPPSLVDLSPFYNTHMSCAAVWSQRG